MFFSGDIAKMSSSALAFLALVAFTAAQTLSADEQQLLEQLQNRDVRNCIARVQASSLIQLVMYVPVD